MVDQDNNVLDRVYNMDLTKKEAQTEYLPLNIYILRYMLELKWCRSARVEFQLLHAGW